MENPTVQKHIENCRRERGALLHERHRKYRALEAALKGTITCHHRCPTSKVIGQIELHFGSCPLVIQCLDEQLVSKDQYVILSSGASVTDRTLNLDAVCLYVAQQVIKGEPDPIETFAAEESE